MNVTVNAPGFVNITVDGVGMITAGLNHTINKKDLLAATPFVSYDGKTTWRPIGLPVGTYPSFAVYLGNENYTSVSTSDVFKVMPLKTTVKVSADDIYVGEDAVIDVVLKLGLNANVTVEVEGVKYTVELTNGKGSLTVSGLKAGLEHVFVKYAGNDTYLESENTTTFTVKKLKPTIDVDSPDIKVGE